MKEWGLFVCSVVLLLVVLIVDVVKIFILVIDFIGFYFLLDIINWDNFVEFVRLR